MGTVQQKSCVTAEWKLESSDTGRLQLSGRLDATTLPEAWQRTVLPAREARPGRLILDAAGLTYCDGAGLGLFTELRRVMAENGGKLEVLHLPEGLDRLVQMSQLADPAVTQLKPVRGPDLVSQVGRSAWELLQDLGQMVAFTGELVAALATAIRHPSRIRVADTLTIAEKAGVNALPVVSLLGLLVGLILAFQTAAPLRSFGALSLIPTLVSVAVIREMGPLITAIILAGRSGSAFAAEIGTMKVTEELGALQTMGLDPTQFLVLPRVLAATVVTPLLTVFSMLLSIIGGYVVMAGLGFSFKFYVNSVMNSVTYVDLLGGVFKAFVFALIIAAVGCLRGTQTQSGPGAVGDSTTRSVVAGIVLTIAADAVLGVVYFALGI